MNYLISENEELTVDRLGKILLMFLTSDLPVLNKRKKYYDGKQAILNKRASDVGRPCSKVVCNYCYNIVQNYNGYLTGIPITYDSESDSFEEIQDVLNYNDVHELDSEYLKQALIYGRSFEIVYLDEESKQRFKTLDTRQCVPIYYNNLNNDLAYVVRFYREDLINKNMENYIVEVYGMIDTKVYRSSMGFASFELLEDRPNYYNQLPITVFSLNDDEDSIFGQVTKLQDAYNATISNALDESESLANAYLLFKGVTADDEDLTNAKERRAFMVDSDADVSYLTKAVNDEATQNLLKTISDQIHKIAQVPDFNDEKFFADSGVALRFKLVSFENAASSIEAHMKKALQRRIELITSVLNMVSGENVWRDINIVFTRNLPISLEPTSVTELMQYKGLVSDQTLLAQVPFVKDVDEEMARVKEEKEASMELYSAQFATGSEGEVEEDEDQQEQ